MCKLKDYTLDLTYYSYSFMTSSLVGVQSMKECQ